MNSSKKYSQKNISPYKEIILVTLTIATITIFQIQLANFIFSNGQAFWQSGSPSYGDIARSIVEQGIYSTDTVNSMANRPPLYPLFLAIFINFSNSDQPIILAQSILTGLTFGFLTSIAYKLTQEAWPTLIMIFLFALNKFIPINCIVQHETVLFTFLLCLGGYIFIFEAKSHSITKVLGLGITLGLACLVRPLASIIFLASLFGFIRLLFTQKSLKLTIIRVLLFTAAFLFTLMPWGVRNWITMDKFLITSTTKGVNLWKGNNPATNDIYPSLDVDELNTLLEDPPPDSGWWDSLREISEMSEIQKDEYLFNLGTQYIIEHPVHFLRMGVIKILALWTPNNIPIALGDIVWTPDGADIHNLRYFYSEILPTSILYLFLVPGLWQQRHSPFAWYIIFLVIGFTIIHFVTFGESRFRWPLNMLMLPLAATGADWAVNKLIISFKSLWKSETTQQPVF